MVGIILILLFNVFSKNVLMRKPKNNKINVYKKGFLTIYNPTSEFQNVRNTINTHLPSQLPDLMLRICFYNSKISFQNILLIEIIY